MKNPKSKLIVDNDTWLLASCRADASHYLGGYSNNKYFSARFKINPLPQNQKIINQIPLNLN